MECSKYVTYDGWQDLEPWERLCRCPICKGFLPQFFPLDKPFKCKKCGTELMTFPDYDEEGEIYEEQGKICPISTGDTP